MTLQEQSATLCEQLARVKSLGADEQLIRSWQPLIRDLPLHLARLERLVAVLRRMKRGDLLPSGRSLVPNGVDALLQKTLPDLRDKLVSKPDKVMQQSGWAKADAGLKGAADALEKLLDAIWETHLQAIAPKLDDWLPFFQGGRFNSEITKIESLHKELDALAQSLPGDDKILKEAEEKSREIHRIVQKLDFGEIPPEVKKFIEQVVNSGGVSLKELNDNVLVWLREKNLLHAFRVNMGGR
jgi:hypothetical protein